MSPAAEKRLLQGVMTVTLLLRSPPRSPASSAARASSAIRRCPHRSRQPFPLARAISGLFLGMLLLFASCIPGIERKGARLRLLALMVVIGRAFRLLSLGLVGMPSLGHRVGLGIELIEVPLIVLWQARVARRMAGQPGTPNAPFVSSDVEKRELVVRGRFSTSLETNGGRAFYDSAPPYRIFCGPKSAGALGK